MVDSLFPKLIVDSWLKAFLKSPKSTIVATILLAFAIGTLIEFVDQWDHEKAEQRRKELMSYDHQTSQLDSIESSLQSLSQFIEHQKTILKENADLISSLENEKSSLQDFVETNRENVDAVLNQYAKNQQESARGERWFGFFFGVFSSLVASLIVYIIRRIFENAAKKRSKTYPHHNP